MPSREKNYRIVDPTEDDVFGWLPHVVRALDPGPIKVFAGVVADRHRKFNKAFRQLPRLNDPTQAGAFTPEEFGEDPAIYAEVVALRKKRRITDGERAYLEQIQKLIPKTLAAEDFRSKAMSQLASSVGSQTYQQYQLASMRHMVSTAILRHQIKGTTTSAYILGRILGFIDIKIAELWSRFSIKNPADPGGDINLPDFREKPEQSPYFPLYEEYDGVLTRLSLRADGEGNESSAVEQVQFPAGSPEYDPTVLDDAEGLYTSLFPRVYSSASSAIRYHFVMNGRNPFGNFEEDVPKRLLPGVYHLSGGSDNRPARVSIPSVDGQSFYGFRALAQGDWGNQIYLTVAANPDGTQRAELTGPQSAVKFKSSFFDLNLTVDAAIFSTLFPPIPVEGNPSSSVEDLPFETYTQSINEVGVSSFGPSFPIIYVDDLPPLDSRVEISGITSLNGEWVVQQVLLEGGFIIDASDSPYAYDFDPLSIPQLSYGRLAGDTPVTGNAAGEFIVSDPLTHWQVDMVAYGEIIASLRDMLEFVRPLTRKVRREVFGFLLHDTMRYAPVNTVNDVVLESPSGQGYRLFVAADGVPRWTATGDPATGEIYQKESVSGFTYKWEVTDQGVFNPVMQSTLTSQDTSIVFLRQDDFTGFVFIRNGVLRTSINSPEEVVQSIYSDGTENEDNLVDDYSLFVESASDVLAPFMGPNAVSNDTPPDDFAFQTSPEDELESRFLFSDGLHTHMAAAYNDSDGTDFGFPSMIEGWWIYDFSGNFVGADVRNRHVGVEGGVIEPVPSGVALDLNNTPNGLKYNYPINFLNYHNKVVWRDRVLNRAKISSYTYASSGDNPNVGPVRVDYSLRDRDGPSETPIVAVGPATTNVSIIGANATPNKQRFEQDVIDSLWRKYEDRSVNLPGPFMSVEDQAGFALLVFNKGTLHSGSKIRIDGSVNHNGIRVVSSFAGDGGDPEKYKASLNDLFVADQSGDLWLLANSIQCWEAETVSVDLFRQSEDGQSVSYRVVEYSDSYETGAHTLLASGSMGLNPVAVEVSVSAGKWVGVEIQGTSRVRVRLTHQFNFGKLNEDVWGGKFMSGGGHRDAVDLTLVEDGQRYFDIGETNDTISSYEHLSGKVIWRGGPWIFGDPLLDEKDEPLLNEDDDPLYV